MSVNTCVTLCHNINFTLHSCKHAVASNSRIQAAFLPYQHGLQYMALTWNHGLDHLIVQFPFSTFSVYSLQLAVCDADFQLG